MKEVIISGEQVNRLIRQENFLQVSLPGEILYPLDSESLKKVSEVVAAVEKVRVIDYFGEPGPNQVIITQGMHGEETKRLNGSGLATGELDSFLRKHPLKLKGQLTIIPNLNAPGCAWTDSNGQPDPVRWVFPDEQLREDKKVHNLNNVFDMYKKGEWTEFIKLLNDPLPKTAMYGWLLMKFIDERRLIREQSVVRAGFTEPKSILFDLHRNDRVTLPTVFIDWFSDDPRLMHKLVEQLADFDLPKFLEGDYWEAERLFETLSAVACRRGFLAYVIEDTNMYNPDPNLAVYVAGEIEKYLVKLDMLKLPPEIALNLDNLAEKIRSETPSLVHGKDLSGRQSREKINHQLDNVYQFRDDQGRIISDRDFLENLTNPLHEGIVRVEFDTGTLGRRGDGKNLVVGRGKFGRSNSAGSKPDFVIEIADFPVEQQIISFQASPFGSREVDFGIYFAYGQLTARPLEELTTDKRLQPGEIAAKLKEGIPVDLWAFGAALAKKDGRLFG